MRDSNNPVIAAYFIGYLTAGLLAMLATDARAECTPNQSEVPVCLSGTVIAPGYAGAVIQETGQAGLRQILPGDMVDNWTVEKIGARYVVLTYGARTVRVELPHPAAANTVAQAVDDTPTSEAAIHGPAEHPLSLDGGGE